MRYSALFILFFLSFCLHAQSGVDLTVRIGGLNYDTLWFGHTYGKRPVAEFFALKQGDGSYRFETREALPAGQYAVLFKRSADAKFSYISCLLVDGQRTFSMDMQVHDVYKTVKVTGSPENEVFYNYVNNVYALMDSRDSAVVEWRMMANEASLLELEAAERRLTGFQDQTIRENPGTLTARLAEMTHFDLPKTTAAAWQARGAARTAWYKAHYFDKKDINSAAFWRAPLAIEWLDFYTFRASPPSPDSVRWYIEDVLKRLEPNPDGYQYYFNYMVNSFARMSRFNFDEVFVYMVRRYVQQGKAPWTAKADSARMILDAGKIEMLLPGKPAPDVTLFTRDSTPVRIYDIVSPYTLLVFWNPDCSHCQRELPVLSRLYEEFKPRGLKVVAICGKKSDLLPTCWKFVDEHQFPAEWYFLADGSYKSRFSTLYDLRAFPKVYLVDAEKKILFRRGGEVPEAELRLLLEQNLN